MTALYNEIEPFAASWLGNLITAGHIASGTVDARSIRDLRPEDVRDATQAHFFAGIGVWSYALKLAGIADDVRVWTGSCPCQPFSAAGKRKGLEDERHLWPAWFSLIRECRPAIIFGEQVASAGDWLDVVSRDLEAEGYAFGAAVLGAHSVGAPHIRQRFYFVAHANERAGGQGRALDGGRHPGGDAKPRAGSSGRRLSGELAHADETGLSLERSARLQRPILHDADGCGADGVVEHASREQVGLPGRARLDRSSVGELGDAREPRRQGCVGPRDVELLGAEESIRSTREAGAFGGFWSDAEWLPCKDGKLRPVEPGTFPLAHGAASRVGRLRAYGNAIVAQQAALFIRAAFDSMSSHAPCAEDVALPPEKQAQDVLATQRALSCAEAGRIRSCAAQALLRSGGG